ncbi:MAG: ATP-dependent DNA ligase [Candidatus Binataceae bacterium]|nr:ATP-dependent DNA ligase [Candidatus Binataceae bacterium]
MPSFYEFALVCQALGQTQSRLQMAELAGEFLARLDPGEAAIAARFMVGRTLAQGGTARLQVSGRAVWKIVAAMTGGADQGEEIFAAAVDFGEAIAMLLRLRPAEPEPALTLAEVARGFIEMAEIEGRNSRRRKLDALRALFERMSVLEGQYLAKVLIGEMRHGMSEGLMLEAIAKMAARPVAEVRRINMLEGDVGRVVRALREPSSVLGPQTTAPDAPARDAAADAAAETVAAIARPAQSAPRDGARQIRPIKPMLAQPAPNVAEVFRLLGDRLALEHKLDGARVQIHCADGAVRIYSRRLNEITASLPEVVESAARIGPRRAIFDGEVIAVDAAGRPLAFQEVMRRFGRVHDVERMRDAQPVALYLFDLMALDGELLIDAPYAERYAALTEIAETHGLGVAGHCTPASLAEGQQFYARAIAVGYEGIVAKALASTYMPGVRGRGWLKIKSVRTLDLVIVAAEWGYGRRHGWLSNYHLAARDERDGALIAVGKTFKGLTDDDFRAMTERLLALKTGEQGGRVSVRPEVVVEVAYSDIQRSPQYAGGMALRFARIVGVRSDKGADEADTIATVAAAFDRQPVRPAADRA